MAELKSMKDYLLERWGDIDGPTTFSTMFIRCVKYATFLETPLALGMFVPCDDEDNVLQEPIHLYSDEPKKEDSKMYKNNPLTIAYEEAKERVLFKGFEIIERNEKLKIVINKEHDIGVCVIRNNKHIYLCSKYKIIEDLVKTGIELNKKIN